MYQLFLSALLALSVAACDGAKTQQEPAAQASEEAEIAKSQPEIKDWEYYEKVLLDAPKEDLDDSKQWEDFRLEFEWKRDNSDREQTESIYSMKMDGSDIRLAVGPELLLGEEKSRVFTRLRSPDNRYMALYLDTQKRRGVVAVVDIKEQKLKVLDQFNNRIRFSWSQDSGHLYFYGSRGLTRYVVETGELVDVEPTIHASALHELYDGNFLAVDSYGYSFIGKDNKELFAARYGKDWGSSGRYGISPDFRYIYVSNTETCVFDLTLTSGAPVFCTEGVSSDDMDLTNDAIATLNRKLEFYPISGEPPVPLAEDIAFSPRYLRVINRQLSSDSKPRYPYLK